MNLRKFNLLPTDCPLSTFFNQLMESMQSMRSLCAPVSFHKDEDIAAFQDEKFCDFVRYELWMTNTVERLMLWAQTIKSYFEDYGGSWEYYATSKRLEFIRENELDVEEDSMDKEKIKYFSVVYDIYQPDKKNIVQDTTLADLGGLFCDLIACASIDYMKELKEHFGSNIEVYRVGENGKAKQITQDDYELDLAVKRADADDYVALLKEIMKKLSGILAVLKSCSYKEDNKEKLWMVKETAEQLLRMDF